MKEKYIYLIAGGVVLTYLVVKYSRKSVVDSEEEETSRGRYALGAVSALAGAGVILSFKNGLWEVATREGFDGDKLAEVMKANWEDLKTLPGHVLEALQNLRKHASAIYNRGVKFYQESFVKKKTGTMSFEEVPLENPVN